LGVLWRTAGRVSSAKCDPFNGYDRAMNLEPQKTESEIRTLSGTARVFAGIVIVALAALSILALLDVIPREAFTAMAGKVALVAGVCVVSIFAIGLLSRR
jgi:hypothetical protein